jgi:hypothetical protein
LQIRNLAQFDKSAVEELSEVLVAAPYRITCVQVAAHRRVKHVHALVSSAELIKTSFLERKVAVGGWLFLFSADFRGNNSLGRVATESSSVMLKALEGGCC